ncbi:MAG: formylglycine-generating enzyme family protein [Polyangiales bacterium]
MVITLPLLASCDSPRGTGLAPRDAIPPSVDIAGATVTVATSIGKLSRKETTTSFSITETPVTVGQYGRCVELGACSSLAAVGPRCGEGSESGLAFAELKEAIDAMPASCATADQAIAYCSWVGARLPRTAEWMQAARGIEPTRFAWGIDGPSCDRTNREPRGETCCGAACNAPETWRVGGHRSGDSPFHVADCEWPLRTE